MCIHRDDKAHDIIETMLGHFAFPIFDVSEVEMARRSAEQNWMPLARGAGGRSAQARHAKGGCYAGLLPLYRRLRRG